MIETDQKGSEILRELQRHRDSSVFNEWEQRFLVDIAGKKYSQLSRHQKAVVSRLYDWLQGS